MKSSLHQPRRPSHHAFGRIDLIVTLVVVVVLLGLGGLFWARAGGNSQTTLCMNNLKHLGSAFELYSKANQQKLPYAAIQYNDSKQFMWDRLVNSYIRADLRGTDKSVPAPSKTKAEQELLCPSDHVPPLAFAVKNNFPRRTYAMPWHNMDKANWPVASSNQTGLGLWWAPYGKSFGHISALQSITSNSPAFTKTMILEPAATILLTEQAKSNNIAGNASGARIRFTGDHLETTIAPKSCHDGRINYLMVDGHVDTLFPADTVGPQGKTGSTYNTHFGMWTVRPGD